MTADQVGPEQVAAARPAVDEAVGRTPVLRLPGIDERLGARIALKAENLQQTGSFKPRGVSAKLDSLGKESEGGVVAGSAGNHGRALAWAARRCGISCDLFVPEEAPVSKTGAAARLGARLHPTPGQVAECLELARDYAEKNGLAFVHAFDDPVVVAGQGSVGLELLEDVDDLARVVIPVGGGGLAAGTAIACKSARPEIEVIGVRVADPSAGTLADGIAIKRPGELTQPLLDRWLDGIEAVSEDDVGDAMALLLAEAKQVVEGAGAVGVAALASGKVKPAAKGTTAVILSGGNVDETVLAAIARRSGALHGRGAVLFTKISDRPGSLARLLEAVGETGASVVDVQHVRDAVDLHVSETGVELILETRGSEHTDRIVDELQEHGYEIQRQHTTEGEK